MVFGCADMLHENEIAKRVVNLCFNIHKLHGPGLFENIYEKILCYEMKKEGLLYTVQKGVKVFHDGRDMGIGFIPDIIVENKVILELKSVETLAQVHHKQLLSYLRITNLKLGLLINFNIPLIKAGIHRVVNNL